MTRRKAECTLRGQGYTRASEVETAFHDDTWIQLWKNPHTGYEAILKGTLDFSKPSQECSVLFEETDTL